MSGLTFYESCKNQANIEQLHGQLDVATQRHAKLGSNEDSEEATERYDYMLLILR